MDRRRAKGVNYVDLVKILKKHRKKHGLAPLSPETEALMAEHLLASTWYPFPILAELVEVTYRVILGGDPDKALQMGIAGGQAAFGGVHRAFVVPNDPLATVLAMGYTWRAYFDFGELTTEAEGDSAVKFTLAGYPDCAEPHGMLIAGWHLSAAIISGVPSPRLEILERPWEGAEELVHRVIL